jgi:hypothetical protein
MAAVLIDPHHQNNNNNLHVPVVLKSGSLNLLEHSGPVLACNGIDLPPVGKAFQPPHFHVRTVSKSGSLNLLEHSGPVQACNGIALPLV